MGIGMGIGEGKVDMIAQEKNILADMDTGEIVLRAEQGSEVTLPLRYFAKFDKSEPIYKRQWFTEARPIGCFELKEAYQKFTSKYHITPSKMQRLGERLFYKYIMTRYGKDVVSKMCYGRFGLNVDKVAKLEENFEKVQLALSDKQLNMIPLVVSTGKSVKEIKDSCSKSVWKKLINNSFSRNKLLAHVISGRWLTNKEATKFVVNIPTSLLKHGLVVDWAFQGTEVEETDWVIDVAKRGRYLGDKRKVVQLCHLVRDVKRMCRQQGIAFNIKWGHKRMEEMHQELIELNRQLLSKRDQARQEQLERSIPYESFPLNSFTYLDGRVEVTLLSSGNEVIEEGRVMRHCVGSYSDSCMQEQYAVFSLKSDSGRSTAGITKHEVRYSAITDSPNTLNWRVQQHYSYCNQEPCKQHSMVVDFIGSLL